MRFINAKRIRSMSPIGVLLALLLACLGATLFGYLCRALMNDKIDRAARDIWTLEAALVQLVSDAHAAPQAMLNPDALAATQKEIMERLDLNAYDAATAIYSRVLSALLLHGSNTPSILAASHDGPIPSDLLLPETVARLSSSYCDIERDPWDTPYQFHVQPWANLWTRSESDDTHARDADGDAHAARPWPRNPPIFIWSLGANRRSDQFAVRPKRRSNARRDQPNQRPMHREFISLFDDINNWDNTEGWRDYYDDLPWYDKLRVVFR